MLGRNHRYAIVAACQGFDVNPCHVTVYGRIFASSASELANGAQFTYRESAV